MMEFQSADIGAFNLRDRLRMGTEKAGTNQYTGIGTR